MPQNPEWWEDPTLSHESIQQFLRSPEFRLMARLLKTWHDSAHHTVMAHDANLHPGPIERAKGRMDVVERIMDTKELGSEMSRMLAAGE